MNRNNIDTNILYDGEWILRFAKSNLFREGDKLLAIQDDVISSYRYVGDENNKYDFIDEEYPEDFLDFWDLANCKFIIMLNKESENYIKVITTPVVFDTDLFIKNHNELIKRWFGNEYR